MKGVRGLQQPAGDVLGLQHLLELGHCLDGPGHHAQLWAIGGGQPDAVGQTRLDDAGGGAHRQHGAAGLRLHQAPARRDQGQRIGQSEDARLTRGHEFTHAVAQHGGRAHAPASPQLGQRILDGEQGGLRVLGSLQKGRRLRALGRLREEQSAQVAHKVRSQDLGAGVDRPPHDGLVLIEGARHVRVLRALAGEQKGDLGIVALDGAGSRGFGREPGQAFTRIIRVPAHEKAPVGKARATSLQRVGHVGQILLGMFGQMSAQVGGGRLQGRSILARQQQQVAGQTQPGRGRGRRLLQDDMRVRATHAKRADPGAPGLALGRRPRFEGCLHPER